MNADDDSLPPMTSQGPSGALDAILGPLSADEFLRDYWESRSLHIANRRGDIYSGILTVSALEQYLGRNDLRYPSLRMIRAGHGVALSEFTRRLSFGNYASDGLIDPDRVYEMYRGGASIVLQMMRSSLEGVGVFCNHLQQELGFNVESTVYVTPASEQGFTTHYDTHSVIILQIAGRKKWRLCNTAVEYPLLDQTFNSATYTRTQARQEITLAAGDLLYVPRGLAHDATAAEGEPSVHITVGLFPVLWRDLFAQQIARLRSDPRFRHAPVSYFAGDDASFAQELKSIASDAIRDVDLSNVLLRLRQQHIARQSRMTHGRLAETIHRSELGLESRIQMRAALVVDVSYSEAKISISFYDRMISFPASVSPAIERIVAGNPVAVRDLQDNLNDDGKLVIGRKFLAEGIATLVD